MVGDGREVFLGGVLDGGVSLPGAFLWLYNLSSLNNHFVFDFLMWIGSSCSFSFGFYHALTDRKTMDVIFILLLLGKHPFHLGRRDVRVRNPFSCKSFFTMLG